MKNYALEATERWGQGNSSSQLRTGACFSQFEWRRAHALDPFLAWPVPTKGVCASLSFVKARSALPLADELRR